MPSLSQWIKKILQKIYPFLQSFLVEVRRVELPFNTIADNPSTYLVGILSSYYYRLPTGYNSRYPVLPYIPTGVRYRVVCIVDAESNTAEDTRSTSLT